MMVSLAALMQQVRVRVVGNLNIVTITLQPGLRLLKRICWR